MMTNTNPGCFQDAVLGYNCRSKLNVVMFVASCSRYFIQHGLGLLSDIYVRGDGSRKPLKSKSKDE